MTNDISPYVSPQFIKVYENIIPHSLCDDLIQKFESNSHQWETRSKLYSKRNLSFKELHFNKYWDTWKKDQENIITILMKQVKVYMSDFSEFCFPINVGLFSCALLFFSYLLKSIHFQGKPFAISNVFSFSVH